jgi:hypothetical protein
VRETDPVLQSGFGGGPERGNCPWPGLHGSGPSKVLSTEHHGNQASGPERFPTRNSIQALIGALPPRVRGSS